MTTEVLDMKIEPKPKALPTQQELIHDWVDKQNLDFRITSLNIHLVYGCMYRVDAYEQIDDGFMLRNKISASWFLKVVIGDGVEPYVEDRSK